MIFYRYFCGGCGSNLLTTKNLVDPVKVRLWLGSICPSCRMRLSGCVEWRQVEVDDFQSLEASLLVEPSHPSIRFPVSFRRVSELQAEPHLSFGDESLDQFLKGLRIGQSVFLYGSWQCLAASELLCIRAQLEARYGGLGSKSIFIDGGNTFDPYLIAHYAERFSLDRDRALNRVLVARAFTCHQLTSFVTQRLPEAIHKREAKLIVASNLIEICRNSDTRQNLNPFKATLNSLSTTVRLERVIALITSLNEKQFGLDPFLRAVKQRVDIVLRFEERRHSTKLILEKHPTRPEESAIIKHPTPRFLEEFLEASTSG